MKRLIVILLCSLYLVFNINLVFHVHYCDGELCRIYFTENHEEEHDACEHEHIHKGQCDEANFFFYTDDSYQLDVSTMYAEHGDPIIEEYMVFSFKPKYIKSFFIKSFFAYHADNSPPKIPYYIQYASLII